MVERSFKHGLSDFKSSSSLSVPIAQQFTTKAKGMASKALTSILSSSDLFWEKVKKKKKTKEKDKREGMKKTKKILILWGPVLEKKKKKKKNPNTCQDSWIEGKGNPAGRGPSKRRPNSANE